MEHNKIGRVTLLGAGPGDKDLMTVKAVEILKTAEVVLYDKLVSKEILDLAPEKAEMINVGKHTNHHILPQKEINALILRKAQEGFHVIRLKGGDPFVFGRGGEELVLLHENNIPFEIVPGITSALSAPLYAGIPITHRGLHSSFHVFTGHMKNNNELNLDYETIAKLEGTLIFLMSVKTFPEIFENLIKAGMNKNTKAAIIENVSSREQRKFISTVEQLPDVAKAENVISPAVVVVGACCELSNKFDWFLKQPAKRATVLLTQSKQSIDKMKQLLKKESIHTVDFPCFATNVLKNDESDITFQKLTDKIESYQWIIFTSKTAVNVFFDMLIEKKIDIRKLNTAKIGVIGSETRREVEKRGLFAAYMPAVFDAVHLGKGLVQEIQADDLVLLPRAKNGATDLIKKFVDHKILFDEFEIYETVFENSDASHVRELIKNNKIDFIVFTSKSAIDGFIHLVGKADLSALKCVCIGIPTLETARQYGFNCFKSELATVDSMVNKIVELIQDGNDS